MHMTCDRCGKSTRGVGYVTYSRHRDDPEDYCHVLCHECEPVYQQECSRWEESHRIPLEEGMPKPDRTAAIQKWADARHERMRENARHENAA
jgi:phage terminase large subunit GpA-like protein